MTSNHQLFGSYLVSELNRRDIDADYANYLLSLLEEGCAIEELLSWLGNIYDGDDFDQLSNEIVGNYENPSLIQETNLAKIIVSTPTPEVSNNDTVSFPPKQDIENDDIVDPESELLLGAELDLIESETEMECLDWVELADHVEESLHDKYPTLEFSHSLIFDLLFRTNGNVHATTQLIIRAHETVNNCRPCRHFLSSRCLRRDCIFDHDLSNVTCRYWLLSVGCSSNTSTNPDSNESDQTTSCYPSTPCVFLHDIPQAWIFDLTQEDININKIDKSLFGDECFPTLPINPKSLKQVASSPPAVDSFSRELESRAVISHSKQPVKFRIGPASYTTVGLSSEVGRTRDHNRVATGTALSRSPGVEAVDLLNNIGIGLQWYAMLVNEAVNVGEDFSRDAKVWVSTGLKLEPVLPVLHCFQ